MYNIMVKQIIVALDQLDNYNQFVLLKNNNWD